MNDFSTPPMNFNRAYGIVLHRSLEPLVAAVKKGREPQDDRIHESILVTLHDKEPETLPFIDDGSEAMDSLIINLSFIGNWLLRFSPIQNAFVEQQLGHYKKENGYELRFGEADILFESGRDREDENWCMVEVKTGQSDSSQQDYHYEKRMMNLIGGRRFLKSQGIEPKLGHLVWINCSYHPQVRPTLYFTPAPREELEGWLSSKERVSLEEIENSKFESRW